MSYVRWGPDSQVYVYTSGTQYNCCGCCIERFRTKNEDYTTKSVRDMIRHLREHRRHNHLVPEYAFENLLHQIGA